MPITDLTIRRINASDRARWEPLWAGYLGFYEQTVSRETTEFTWRRLTTSHEIEGLLAVAENGEALGMAHILYHPSTWNVGGKCYLQDLFVIPAARGRGVGRRLIAAAADSARARGAVMLYWQTEEFNGPARRLYERVAKRSPFILYEVDL